MVGRTLAGSPDVPGTSGQWSPWRYYGVAVLLWVLVFALLTALALSYEMRRLEKEFLRTAAAVEHTVRERLGVSSALLDGLSFALATRGRPDLAFERYARHVLVNHRQIARIQTLRRVPVAGREAFLTRMRQRYNGAYALRSFAFRAARRWFPAPASDEYYPITFLVPDGSPHDSMLGLDVGSIAFLRAPLKLALATDEATASPPFQLLDGATGFMLFQAASEDGDAAVGLTLRTDRLLASNQLQPASLNVALRYLGTDGAEVALATAEPPGRLARLLLPRYTEQRWIGTPRSPFTLLIEQAIAWRDLSPAPLVPMLALSLLGLPAALGMARQRHNWDRALAEYQRDLTFRATHDPLTGLPNRTLFLDRFEHARELARRGGERFALVFIDLDNFKQLNDHYGHAAGDAVLRSTAQRVARALRKGDTVARIGGDEFLVLLEGLSGRRATADATQHIVRALRAPIEHEQRVLRIDASVGVALYPDDGDSYAALSSAADAAMYRQKRARNDAAPAPRPFGTGA